MSLEETMQTLNEQFFSTKKGHNRNKIKLYIDQFSFKIFRPSYYAQIENRNPL